MKKHFARSRRRSDVLLLLPEQVADWQTQCRERPEMAEGIAVRDWSDVAIALRSALPLRAGESMRWRVWAHALCGAIEQDLLKLPAGADPRRWSDSLTYRRLETARRLFAHLGDM